MPRLHGRRGQFEHYMRLSNAIERHVKPGERDPLVVFSDDDDLWHPQRAEEYFIAAQDHPDAQVLTSRVHASPGLSPRLSESASSKDATQRLLDGQYRIAVA